MSLKYSNNDINLIKSKTDNLTSDPADQSQIDSKLGETTDYASHQTLLGYQNSLYQHVHKPSKCYPDLADGITITGGVSAWTLGSFVEIIPADTITTAFDIHWIEVEAVNAVDTYQLKLYSGAEGSEEEIGCVRFTRASNQTGASNVPIQIPFQHANTRISAKLASKSGGSDTATISLYYHIYE